MTDILMAPVTSSNIDAYGYDTDANEMHVRFKGGVTHVYSGVPVEVRRAFVASDSKGTFFHAHVRGKYQSRKL